MLVDQNGHPIKTLPQAQLPSMTAQELAAAVKRERDSRPWPYGEAVSDVFPADAFAEVGFSRPVGACLMLQGEILASQKFKHASSLLQASEADADQRVDRWRVVGIGPDVKHVCVGDYVTHMGAASDKIRPNSDGDPFPCLTVVVHETMISSVTSAKAMRFYDAIQQAAQDPLGLLGGPIDVTMPMFRYLAKYESDFRGSISSEWLVVVSELILDYINKNKDTAQESEQE